ncbi:MAG: PQQ-binding-like beta-propeller repeat protein [Planctomycetota bacterium]
MSSLDRRLRNIAPRRPRRRSAITLAGIVRLALLLPLFTASALADVGAKSGSGTYLPSNRLDARGIQRARELIAKGEFSQSIRFLDEVLARSEDSFVVGTGNDYHGLKESAREILGSLPPEGRAIYQTTFGPVARRLLKQATSAGDVDRLRQIAQRYFHTQAGHEAALLFAQCEADQGRHLTAALTYEQLLDSTEAEARFQPQLSILAATSWLAESNVPRANEILRMLEDRGFRSVKLADQDHRLQSPGRDAEQWLRDLVGSPLIKDAVAEQQWLMHRGNAARNGTTDGGLPHLRVRWQVRLLEHHNLESVHDEMQGLLSRQQRSKVPAGTPLAVGNYVVTRSPHGLLAIDFRTGKRVWRSQPQPKRVGLLQGLMDGTDDQNENDIEPAQTFAQTIWDDYLYNTISSDGQRVYVIRDLAPPAPDNSQAMPFLRPNNAALSDDRSTNRLCAYDLRTQGKLVWEVDGAARSDQLAGAFFLGAPVAVGQRLYCLAEIKSDTAVYLVALNRNTGELQWRQQLVDLERRIDHDLRRRLQASMPSYDEGMLICPTGAGVVVAVDLAKQALAWAYQYPNAKSGLTHRQRIVLRQRGKTLPHWVHSAPIIAGGRVLITPPESDELHCLDLVTGKLLWKKPRGKAMFVAGVNQDLVMLVGLREVYALHLEDGTAAWPMGIRELPGNSTPTGTGFLNQGQYFLPLSNAQVVAIDVASGNITARANSRVGQVLGNLVCYRGSVLSQDGRYLACFDQIDVLRSESQRRLTADSNDFEALRTLGEIAYNDGKLEESLELLIQAHESAPDDLRTREALAEALEAALNEDFETHQHLLPLLTQIQGNTLDGQLTLLRLQAQGLQEMGQSEAAFEICIDAYSRLGAAELDLSLGQDHTVDARRWLSAQVASSWVAASDEQRTRMTARLAPLIDEGLESPDLAVRRLLFDSFQAVETSDTVGLRIAEDLVLNEELLDAQQLLLDLSQSKNAATRATATALSSRLLHENGMPFLATSYDKALAGAWADVQCLDGMTGLQCLAQWNDANDGGGVDWPYGQVDVFVDETKTPRGSSSSRIPSTGIYLERSDDLLGQCNVTLAGMVSGRNRALTIQDSLGRTFYSAKLDPRTRTTSPQTGVYGVSRGNLLIVSLGRQIVAFDTLSDSKLPLWRKDTTSNLHYVNQHRVSISGNVGRHRSGRAQNQGNWLGVIGPVTRNSCIFQVEERLVCVDSLTGQEKWSRNDIPLGCDLYGDEQYMFAVPKGSEQAIILRTADGRKLGETASIIPPWPERLATRNTNIVRWRRRASSNRWELSAIGSVTGEVVWKYDFAKKSQADIMQNRFVAVAEPGGRCVVVDIESGHQVVDQQIKPNLSMQRVHLFVGQDDFLVAIQQPLRIERRIRYVTGFNAFDFTKPFAGQLYRFDRVAGEALWSGAAEVAGLPLMLAQGVDLPMIAFAGNIRRQDKQGSKHEIGVMLLERATGRLLYHNDQLPPSAHYCLVKVPDPSSNEAVVEMINRKIRLQFTDTPRAPEPPAMLGVARTEDDKQNGLKKIGQRLLDEF